MLKIQFLQPQKQVCQQQNLRSQNCRSKMVNLQKLPMKLGKIPLQKVMIICPIFPALGMAQNKMSIRETFGRLHL